MFYQRRLRFKPDFCALKNTVDWIKSETCFFGQKTHVWRTPAAMARMLQTHREGQLGKTLWKTYKKPWKIAMFNG
jgi:hypothetical protein